MREAGDMSTTLTGIGTAVSTHPWLHSIAVAFVPGHTTPLLQSFAVRLLHDFRRLGHRTQAAPDSSTDAILTTARFGDVVSWREALLFSGRRRFSLTRLPTVFTLLHIAPGSLETALRRFETALAKDSPRPQDYLYTGLAPRAHRVLHEQGRRGGPLLALLRLLQAQTKSIRIVLVVGGERPVEAYHFDLVGAHPRTLAEDEAFFYRDIALRIVTAVSTRELTKHQVVGDLIPRSQWLGLSTPAAMRAASRQLAKRNFFTEMLRISDLVRVPAMEDGVARQYSEGCFATWDTGLRALIATATGSAKPVDKGNITHDMLAVIDGISPDGRGALVRHVEGLDNLPPSSEAVEMIGMDQGLPTIKLGRSWAISSQVPVVRSKLHGHRGVAAYDPSRVEYVPLDACYHHYPVSCATEAQALGVKHAFARSEALRRPADPRQVVFTILPGHGLITAEKWAEWKAPFQVIWEYMDAGFLEIECRIPQGPVAYIKSSNRRMVLRTE
jgi:hypothetical protein